MEVLISYCLGELLELNCKINAFVFTEAENRHYYSRSVIDLDNLSRQLIVCDNLSVHKSSRQVIAVNT